MTRMIWGVKIPLRDGIHLNATVYLPEKQAEPAPAIFLLTPYVGQTYHDRGVFFAEHGYPFLTVDVRGRGNSDGVFKANGNEAQDGYDIVEWLARQPYCNGRVAMWGGSYSGYVQWCAAREFPPHLATIVPVAAPYRGVDSPMRNNIFGPYRIQWLTLLAGRTSQDRIFADLRFWNQQFRRWFESGTAFRRIDEFLGNSSPIFQQWLSHPEQDSYWDSFNPTAEQYAKLRMPVLTITGIYDGNQTGALTHYRQHMRNAAPEQRAHHYLVIGPWDHAGTRTPQARFVGLEVGPAALVDLPKLHLDWYAWVMQAGEQPAFLEKNVAYYVMGAEKWRYADTLEAVTSEVVPYFLSSTTNPTDVFTAGAMRPQGAGIDGTDSYVYDPRDISLAGLEATVDPENRVDQRMIHAAAGKQLVYHSAPFQTDTEISGFFSLTVWLAIDQPDTDFRVVIQEIAMDGSAVELCKESVRARYRESLREARLVGTQAPQRYELDSFMFVARLVRKGCRLRLVIGPLNSIFSQKNYNSGNAVADETMADARAVTVRLFHGPSFPSALHVPLGVPEEDRV